jgi:hypothetical protein
MLRHRFVSPLLLAITLLIASILYAPLFRGFWLGDDFANLLLSASLGERGELTSGMLSYFVSGLSSTGSLYRPMSMVSLIGNYAFAGDNFALWFAVNLGVHLANVALIYLVVRQAAVHLELDSTFAAPAAAALFALAPSLAEGVFWISARADGWVTLLSLLALHIWLRALNSQRTSGLWWLLPLMLIALGFKESAALFPLQLSLLTLAWWPVVSRRHLQLLAFAFLVTALYFLVRHLLFGQVWGVYVAPGSSESLPLLGGFSAAIRSIPAWWLAMTSTVPQLAAVYLYLFAFFLAALVYVAHSRSRRVALALLAAALGYALATLLNLKGMAASGEGGRLSYGPMCWLTLAIGVALCREDRRLAANVAAISLATAIIAVGALVLSSLVQQALTAQNNVRHLRDALANWTTTRQGSAIVFVPEMTGFVVSTRNAQGGLVFPPIQRTGIVHRVLPTLPSEVAARYDGYRLGLQTRLNEEAPTRYDPALLTTLQQPAATQWPDHHLCWSTAKQRLVELNAPRVDTRAHWIEDLRAGLASHCKL